MTDQQKIRNRVRAGFIRRHLNCLSDEQLIRVDDLLHNVLITAARERMASLPANQSATVPATVPDTVNKTTGRDWSKYDWSQFAQYAEPQEEPDATGRYWVGIVK